MRRREISRHRYQFMSLSHISSHVPFSLIYVYVEAQHQFLVVCFFCHQKLRVKYAHYFVLTFKKSPEMPRTNYFM